MVGSIAGACIGGLKKVLTLGEVRELLIILQKQHISALYQYFFLDQNGHRVTSTDGVRSPLELDPALSRNSIGGTRSKSRSLRREGTARSLLP